MLGGWSCVAIRRDNDTIRSQHSRGLLGHWSASPGEMYAAILTADHSLFPRRTVQKRVRLASKSLWLFVTP